MNITRVYYNSDGDTIRIDDISIDIGPPMVAYPSFRLLNDPGLMMRVGAQKVRTQLVTSGSSSVSDRDVTKIDVIGDYDDYGESGAYPPYNIDWVSKTLGNGQIIRFDMNGLAKVGDTV